MKSSFIVYHEIEEQTAILTDEQAGQLFRAMLRFSKGGEPEFSDPLVALAFSFVRPTMERDRRKYEEVCTKRQEAGRKGGKPKKQQPAEGGDFLAENQMVSEKPDNVNVYVYENDYDYVREDVYVSDSLDSQDAPDAQGVQTQDCDTCERDAGDVQRYAEKQGYRFTAKQRKRLRHWCSVFPFESVILAFDRSTFYGGKSVTYVYRILQEWQDKGLHDPGAVEAYLTEREGGAMACAV